MSDRSVAKRNASHAEMKTVEVKLFLTEFRICGISAELGFHHPSAMTLPCRRIMKLSKL